ncbi:MULTISPECIES: formate/nitrite transporter family protein [unclassified Sedimentibacter]|uniref:formate/nitrite transporter family protein n=1 Tax=unclassified Sedimentibacter TaxID=2649220 RepID=UPI0027E0EC09|nr:formate/nitrite transporter family protein [Sedimentibacter sp. MB35-C1]WMJ77740.1 formate/nitrite transporter family protein [Sedimentibacter sp. MB35-C1]
MSNVCLTPKETSEALIESAQKKVAMTVKKRYIMSIMAGLYISLGAQGFMVTYDNLFIRAAVFPVGLMLIVLVGGELFTGNCLMTFALLHKKITFKDYMSSLLQVLIGNLIGALVAVGFLYFGGIYNNPAMAETVVNIANSKLSLSFTEALFKGILCNVLVSLGVWFATTSKDTTGKILGCWFPIMLFVLCGYEHVVANMFYLPMAMIVDSAITISEVVLDNFIPVAIGNFIGGGILVPIMYYRVYYK